MNFSKSLKICILNLKQNQPFFTKLWRYTKSQKIVAVFVSSLHYQWKWYHLHQFQSKNFCSYRLFIKIYGKQILTTYTIFLITLLANESPHVLSYDEIKTPKWCHQFVCHYLTRKLLPHCYLMDVSLSPSIKKHLLK